MDISNDPEYYKILCERFSHWTEIFYSANRANPDEDRLRIFIWRIEAAMKDHSCYDDNDPVESHKEQMEQSYEDWLELQAPVEHPGDSWKNNEDI